ncbi:Peptide chain release factor PrfB1, chloroplastic [Linum perenne]
MDGLMRSSLDSSSSILVSVLKPSSRLSIPSVILPQSSYHSSSFNSTVLNALSTPYRCPPFVVQAAAPESQSLGTEIDTEKREWALQDFYGLRKDVEAASERVKDVRGSAGLKQLEQEIADLESKTADSSFWDHQSEAQQTLLALTDVKEKMRLLTEFETKVEDAETIIKLTEEMDSVDSGLLEEASIIVKELNKALDKYEVTQLLSGPYDKEGAVISITAGAGGTDAQCRTGLTCFSECM